MQITQIWAPPLAQHRAVAAARAAVACGMRKSCWPRCVTMARPEPHVHDGALRISGPRHRGSAAEVLRRHAAPAPLTHRDHGSRLPRTPSSRHLAPNSAVATLRMPPRRVLPATPYPDRRARSCCAAPLPTSPAPLTRDPPPGALAVCGPPLPLSAARKPSLLPSSLNFLFSLLTIPFQPCFALPYLHDPNDLASDLATMITAQQTIALTNDHGQLRCG